MFDNPKTIGIIILIINLLVLGPTSYIIKNLRSDIIDLKEVSRKRNDDLINRIDSLRNNQDYYIDRETYEKDQGYMKTRMNIIEGRIYEIHTH